MKKRIVGPVDDTPPQAKMKTTIIVDFTEYQVQKILLDYIKNALNIAEPLHKELEILISSVDYDCATFDGARFVREET